MFVQREKGKGGRNFATFFIFRFASTRLSNETRSFFEGKISKFSGEKHFPPPPHSTFSILSKMAKLVSTGKSVDSRSADVFQFHTRAPPSFSPHRGESVTGSNEKFTIPRPSFPFSFFSFPSFVRGVIQLRMYRQSCLRSDLYLYGVTSNAVFEPFLPSFTRLRNFGLASSHEIPVTPRHVVIHGEEERASRINAERRGSKGN